MLLFRRLFGGAQASLDQQIIDIGLAEIDDLRPEQGLLAGSDAETRHLHAGNRHIRLVPAAERQYLDIDSFGIRQVVFCFVAQLP